MLVDNEQCRDNRAACGEQFCDKKERSRKLSKTVIINAALILSSVPRKILKPITVKHSKNAGVVITVSKASEDRKISCNPAFTDTTKQSAATSAKVSNSECNKCSVAMVSNHYRDYRKTF